MLWDKGVGELVEAARILKQRKVLVRVVLAGVPDLANPACITETQLRSWHEQGVVEWIGYQDDMPALLAQSHIVCLPSSYREGIPRILIEAASCALPIVTTHTPGCREIVRDGWNGLLVPIKNPMALANALQLLLTHPYLRQIMGQRGRERVLKGFSKERVIKETLTVYNMLLANGVDT
jgi:glycosyltransferase involved in cell wall biosynthesis